MYRGAFEKKGKFIRNSSFKKKEPSDVGRLDTGRISAVLLCLLLTFYSNSFYFWLNQALHKAAGEIDAVVRLGNKYIDEQVWM